MLNSSKKTNKKIRFQVELFSFFGRIEDTKRTFRNQLTFIKDFISISYLDFEQSICSIEKHVYPNQIACFCNNFSQKCLQMSWHHWNETFTTFDHDFHSKVQVSIHSKFLCLMFPDTLVLSYFSYLFIGLIFLTNTNK